jgi:hypothetical protein
VHNIANQHPAGEAARRQEYPPQGRDNGTRGRGRDGRSNRADITACSMARIAHTQQGIAWKQRPPGTGCLKRNQPKTRGLSRTHSTTTTHNHTTAATPNIHPTTHISTIRRYKLYHPRTRLLINQIHTTKITPKHQNNKTSPIIRIVESST